MQRPYRKLTSVGKSLMLPQQYFDGSNPETARNHWKDIKNVLHF